MSRERNGEMRNVNSALDTINAAATAIASAESRVPRSAAHRRRWTSCWSVYWCFGYPKNSKRIGHAVLVPESTHHGGSQTSMTPTENLTQPPSIRIPFVAPPSSPASFLPSEPPSTVHSPALSVGRNFISTNMYSPGGPRSIFAIGPYAHETQLVTPPVFSTYTTEPSTAPFTPPPESVHLTTPSSPEVPFAQLLDPIHRFPSSHYEFQSYLLHPGSPVGPLISPGSAISGSGTSSPFLDRDFPGGVHYFPDTRYGFNVGLTHESGSVTPDAYCPNLAEGHQNNGVLIDPRVSFDLQNSDERDHENTNGTVDESARHQKQRAASLGSIKEFNFDHVNGSDSDKPPCVNSNWWANEKVVGKEGEPCKNWAFFLMMQPGVS